MFKDLGIRKYLANISWLTGERVISFSVTFCVNICVVRYLGPEQFGYFAFAQSVVLLVAIFSNLGLDSIVVKELVNETEKNDVVLGTTLWLRLVGGVFVALIVSLVTLFTQMTIQEKLLIAVSSLVLVFQSTDVFASFFQSELKSQYVAKANVTQTIILAVMKLFLIWVSAPLLWFACANVLGAVVLASALIVGFKHYQKRTSGVPSISNWKVTHTVTLKLLRDSWPLMFSGLALSIYMRIDQIMLRMMVSVSALGKYSAAVRIAESWLFFAVIITTTLFPAILNAKKKNESRYLEHLQHFYDLMLWLPILVAGGIYFFADTIISIAFGKEFYDSVSVLKIYAWAGVFVFMITASSRWFIIEGYEKSILYRALTGAVLNIVLNIVLIPLYGIDGAALATLFSYGVMAFLYDAIDPRGHKSFRLKLRAIGAPLRLLKDRLDNHAGA